MSSPVGGEEFGGEGDAETSHAQDDFGVAVSLVRLRSRCSGPRLCGIGQGAPRYGESPIRLKRRRFPLLGFQRNQVRNERRSFGLHYRLGMTLRASRGGQQITSRGDTPAT
jgi:hypothetical protein